MLNILQYNTHKEAMVLLALMGDPRTSKVDAIAVQETGFELPPHQQLTQANTPFLPLYSSDSASWVGFLLNTNLYTSGSWTVDFPHKDVGILIIWKDTQPIHIINIYSPCPEGHGNIILTSEIYQLSSWIPIIQNDHVILLGDFNLHHPTWNPSYISDQHVMASDLLEGAGSLGLSLATPEGLKTCRKGCETTINLAFVSTSLEQQLVSCTYTEGFDHGSDHYPILSSFAWQDSPPVRKQAYKWKDLDLATVQAGSHLLLQPKNLDSKQQIDCYVEYLQKYILDLANKAVPKSSGQPKTQACSWWTLEIEELVHEEQRLRRQDWGSEAVKEASRKKKKAIKNERCCQFHHFTHNLAKDSKVLWTLAKWSRLQSHLCKKPPIIPPMQDLNGMASTHTAKANVFACCFFSEVPDADLNDIPHMQHPEPIPGLTPSTTDEIARILASIESWKAPGPDGIPNGFLKAMGSPLVEALRTLTEACWNWQYHPQLFKHAKTVVLHKPGKKNYSLAGFWRPIALLNTLGKMVEAVTAKRMQKIAEEYGLLPLKQMGARQDRSTESALDLLVSQIRTVWAGEGSNKGVTTILLLDMSGAFDNVVTERLIAVLKTKGLPETLIGWTASFMTNRSTSLWFENQSSQSFNIPTGIPQGSPISPILFLFYNAELIDICNPPYEWAIGIGFVDDANILAYGKTTEETTQHLKRLHDRCMAWARRYGATFAPEKYGLMHFTAATSWLHINLSLDLDGTIVAPVQSLWVLGLILDPKLNWGAHLRHTQKKMGTQINAIACLSGSTWGLLLKECRLIYHMAILPAMAYACHIWHQPVVPGAVPKGIVNKLELIQCQCLRMVTGGFRATPTHILESHTNTPPLHLALTARTASYRAKAATSDIDEMLKTQCLWAHRSLFLPTIPWTQLAPRIHHNKSIPMEWYSTWLTHAETSRGQMMTPKLSTQAWKATWAVWLQHWQAQMQNSSIPIPQHISPGRQAMVAHGGLHKAQSSILTQIRCGKIGLAKFLYTCQVPGYNTPCCSCGSGDETPAHVTLYCNKYQGHRHELLIEGRLDYNRLLGTAQRAHQLTK